MGKPLAITRTDYRADELRALASKIRDGAVVRRLLALAFVLDGRPRSEAADQTGMDRQTLRDWVHRYNDMGIAGLKSGHGPGKPPLLSEAQMAELKATVLKGPDLAQPRSGATRCGPLALHRSPCGGLPALRRRCQRADHREMVAQDGSDPATTASFPSEKG